MKKVVYLDLDDTLADFTGDKVFSNGFDVAYMYEPQFFLNLKPIEGSQVAVRQIMKMGYDVHILSQPVAESAHSYSEKAQWIGIHFPDLINKLHLTQDKGLFVGAYLIDDNEHKWKDKFEANGGKFLSFVYGLNHRAQWINIVNYLQMQKELENHESNT